MSLFDKLKSLVGSKSISVDKVREAAIKESVTLSKSSLKQAHQEANEPIEITEDYKAVIDAIEANEKFIFVSGSAGTGKTTLIKYLVKKYYGKTAVIAPTGVAALQVGGQTINSFCKLPPRIIFPESDVKKLSDRKLYAALKLLIIDEISMVRADTLDAVEYFMRLNGPVPNATFGDLQVIFVGDLFQLPPVVTSEDMKVLHDRNYQSPYFFAAHALSRQNMTVVELQKVFRQKETSFATLLSHIRLAENVDEVINQINQACLKKNATPNSDSITLTTTNNRADLINTSELSKLSGPRFTFHGISEGKFNLDEKNLPSPLNLELKVGAKVMFTANGGQWVNGTIGQVNEITQFGVKVAIDKSHAKVIVDVPLNEWKSYVYEYNPQTERVEPKEIGKYRQLPLMLAWAVTIHKSQGKTIDKINVDLSHGAFAAGQVYVALSRCPTLEGVSLTKPIERKDVICNPEVIRFYTSLLGE